MSIFRFRRTNIEAEFESKKNSTVLNFQKSIDGKMGPCDFFNYNFRTNYFWFGILTPIIRFIIKRGWRVKIYGKENLPKDSNFVVMPNHVSHLDGFLVAANINRPPLVIADEKLMRNKYFHAFGRMMNVFPVRKGTKSTDIVEYSISRVNRGDTMMWFPEGQRHKNPSENKCNPGKLGSGMFAHSVSAPIIPAFITGAEFAMPVGKRLSTGRGPRSIEVTLTYGKPVYLDDLRSLPKSKETSRKVVDRIIEGIEELRPKGPYMVQRTRHWQKNPTKK
ncbi:MAG: 1-acyl-sn-glycerol-3-phosphate acyltransferase [Candidatus Heimdallarchaeota archaeon]|nr:1-acyl-sn-glycerol-3-phosphate acyltransferase [Candidatus Heimdallarchaeota archaeon]